MIPIQLQIKNFLSYGSELQVLDFEPYQLICLSGKNGHGKSAMLDAMTWAIWGIARKTFGTAKADHGLLRLGQRQMMVIFDFEFNKRKYRIRREFTFAYGKPYAYLEFGIFENQDKVTSLTGKTIKATQEKIESMIGLSYDSFINSAFLRQGNSNEFSGKSAKERKEVLANILGLYKYELIRKMALEKIKNVINQKDSILKLCEHVQKELISYNEIQSNLLKIKDELKNINQLEENLTNKKVEIDKLKEAFLHKTQESNLINSQLKKLKEYYKLKNDFFVNTYKEWKQSHRKKLLLKNQKELENEKNLLIKKNEEFQDKLKHKLELKEAILKLKESEQVLLNNLNEKSKKQVNDLNLLLEKLKINKINYKEKINDFENHQKLLNNDLLKIDSELNSLKIQIIDIKEETLNQYEKQFEKRKNFYQDLITKGNWIKSELSGIQQKKILSFDEKNPSCPLCEQNLSISRKKFLKQQFSKQEKFYNHRLKRISELLIKLKEILIKQNDEIQLQKKNIEQNKFVSIKIAELEKQKEKVNFNLLDLNKNKLKTINEFNEIENQLLEKQNELLQLEQKNQNSIQNNKDYKKLILEISNLNNEISNFNCDENEYKKVTNRLNELRLLLQDQENASQINLIQEKRKIEIAQICAELKKVKNEIMQLEARLLEFNNLKEDESNIAIQENEFLKNIQNLNKKKEFLLNQHGSVQNQLEKLDQLANEHKKQKKIILELDEVSQDYKSISIALSKDGIQALLIEEAIPEIENEANELLSKLTDNQAQILIESVRDLKKGGTRETLDIKISDNVGIRPYEMFSGGEAFRIDFALRIAISKLLARRAGTSLQTLIIDEGFGSQDEEGLLLIMDALYKIQDDFAKIIIVSHLPSMKDQFPVHFFVEKSPAGSKVRIIEQG